MLFLQISEQLPEKLIDVSPFNAIAYGVLVTVLFGAVVSLYRMYQSEKRYNRDRDEKMLEILPLITDRLNNQTSMPQNLEKIAVDTKQILAKNEEVARRIEDKQNELLSLFNKHYQK